MPAKYKSNFIDGVDEIDLIRSGLDDMMIDGFQEVKKEFMQNEKYLISEQLPTKLLLRRLPCHMTSIGL